MFPDKNCANLLQYVPYLAKPVYLAEAENLCYFLGRMLT